MLGLGDIVIPGIFVALLLRYDYHNEYRTNYFASAFSGYFAGLTATIVVMNVFHVRAHPPCSCYIALEAIPQDPLQRMGQARCVL